MDMNKPYKGQIKDWTKREFSAEKWAELNPDDPPVLGYFIAGCPIGHPKFSGYIWTSPVVKHEGDDIETLNSRYHLV